MIRDDRRPLSDALALCADTLTRERGFDLLVPYAREFAELYLCHKCRDQEEHDDVVQDTLVKWFQAKGSFKPRTEGEFARYVQVIALRALLDDRRRTGQAVAVADDWIRQRSDAGLSVEERVLIDDCSGRLRDLTDEALLGVRMETAARKIFALRQRLDGVPVQDILDDLNSNPHELPVTRSDLEEWQRDVVPLRYLAFEALYVSGADLAKWVLGCGDDPIEADVIDLLRRSDSEVEGWDRAEVSAVIWRFCFGLSPQRIIGMNGEGASDKVLKELFVRCESYFPFVRICKELGQGAGLGGRFRELLRDKHVWQRLAFEHRYIDDLPVEDIWRRLKEAASACLAQMNETTLKNSWLGGHKLVRRVQRLYEQEQEA